MYTYKDETVSCFMAMCKTKTCQAEYGKF